jgi:Serine aminopeptidase, S33
MLHLSSTTAAEITGPIFWLLVIMKVCLCSNFLLLFHSTNKKLYFLTAPVGHGLSEGDRVHVNSGKTYINDVMQHIKIVKERYSGVPIFIIGHSMVCTGIL